MATNNIKNFLYMMVVQCGNYLFPIITIPLVYRVYSPEMMGVYSYILSCTIYVSLVIAYGFNFSGVRRLTKGNNSSLVFFTIFNAKCLLLFLCVVFYVVVCCYVPIFRENKFVAWSCFLGCISNVFLQNWFFQANSDFKIIAIFSFITKMIGMVFIVCFIRTGVSISIYSMITQSVIFSSAFFSFLYAIFKYELRYSLSSVGNVFSFLKEDWYVFAINILANLYTTTTIVILGGMSNTHEVGIYSSAQRIIDILRNIVITPASMILFPMITKAYSRSAIIGKEMTQRIYVLYIIVSILILLSYFLFGHSLVTIFLGANYAQASQLIYILIFGFVALFFGVVIGGQSLIGLGLDKKIVKLQCIVALFSVSSNYMILPHGGAITSAYVWTFSEILMSIGQYKILRDNKVFLFNRDFFNLGEIRKSITILK